MSTMGTPIETPHLRAKRAIDDLETAINDLMKEMGVVGASIKPILDLLRASVDGIATPKPPLE